VFTTDHGIDMPRAKVSLYDPGIEAALIMRYPARFGGSTAQDALLSNVDLLPTLLDLVGAEVPDDIDGRSFLRLREGRGYEPRDQIVAEMTWHGVYVPMRAIRTRSFKYIRNFDFQGAYAISVWTNAGREVLNEALVGVRPIDELYDLEKDPFEHTNLAPSRSIPSFFGRLSHGEEFSPGNANYAQILKKMRLQLKAHMECTRDPLLTDPVPHPGFAHLWEGA
jgi:arylsulfatase A-like enzyme